MTTPLTAATREPNGPGLPTDAPPRETVAVWDLGVRVFHWALVVTFALCAYSGFLAPRNWLNVHLYSGAALTALVAFRLVWGWLGSTHALFSDFAPTRAAIAAHVRDIAHGVQHRVLGHNPFGATMVFAVLFMLVLLAATGVVALGGADKQGPLAFVASYTAGTTALGIHETLAKIMLGLVAMHLAGVAFESWRLRENLVQAMITGRKRTDLADHTTARPARVWEAGVTLAVLAAVIVPGINKLSQLPARGVPGPTRLALYEKECGSCHFAHPPSLAAAPVWTAIMAGLADHFGENASLDATKTTDIRAWLVGNASEHFDTRVAHMARRMNPAEPLRITASPRWVRYHHDLPRALFTSREVGAKAACNACHRDAATGRFDPQSIAIPRKGLT